VGMLKKLEKAVSSTIGGISANLLVDWTVGTLKGILPS
jgi:hypothetical protein